jgi:excisionase family DNA binding protein
MTDATTRNNTHPVEPLLFDRRTTAKLLSISIRSVDYMVQNGKLGHRKIGTRVLIPASQVRRMADTGCPFGVL